MSSHGKVRVFSVKYIIRKYRFPFKVRSKKNFKKIILILKIVLKNVFRLTDYTMLALHSCEKNPEPDDGVWSTKRRPSNVKGKRTGHV